MNINVRLVCKYLPTDTMTTKIITLSIIYQHDFLRYNEAQPLTSSSLLPSALALIFKVTDGL